MEEFIQQLQTVPHLQNSSVKQKFNLVGKKMRKMFVYLNLLLCNELFAHLGPELQCLLKVKEDLLKLSIDFSGCEK